MHKNTGYTARVHQVRHGVATLIKHLYRKQSLLVYFGHDLYNYMSKIINSCSGQC